MEDREMHSRDGKGDRRLLRKSYMVFICGALFLFIAMVFPADVETVQNLRLRLSYPEKRRVTNKPVMFFRSKNQSLQIAWLMSFPNSGTSFTGHFVRSLGMVNSGTNYGHENNNNETGTSIPIFGDQPGGPFWMDPNMYPNYSFPTRWVMVKTHCGGRCETCPPSQYGESTYSFKYKCLAGTRRTKVNSTFVDEKVSYPADRVTKAIHLVRDPFDNVVSRFHLEQKGNRSGSRFDSSKDGFRGYCEYLNQRFDEEEKRSILFHTELLEMMEDIPCRADFYRYIEWHNQAFALTKDLQLDTMVLYYDDYSTNMVEVTNRLVEFLALKPAGEIHEFAPGKVYSDFYTLEERRTVRAALELMSTRETWHHIKKYFKEEMGEA